MKLKLFVMAIFAFLPILSFGQGASLTIFSEDGDKFILFLNGQQQNVEGQTNLRLDGLGQPYYKAKIVFEDKAKGQIEKNIPVTDPATNAPSDVVYRIKNKDGDMKLRYYSAQPIQPNYVPPADVHVVHYGQPDQVTVTQTTVTSTSGTNSGNGGVSIGVNTGGVNMNINVNDPNMNGGVTQQTTTTTTTSYSNTTTNSGYNNQPAPTGCAYPMDASSFNSAKQTVANASFEDTKLSTAKSILSSNCFSTDQVVAICKLFSFEESKLNFAKFAYSKTTDPGNYFKVGNVFSFDASKTDLNNFISNGGR
jgi:Domain of unknown function (DUF4476)